jgi:hypothetical protein
MKHPSDRPLIRARHSASHAQFVHECLHHERSVSIA